MMSATTLFVTRLSAATLSVTKWSVTTNLHSKSEKSLQSLLFVLKNLRKKCDNLDDNNLQKKGEKPDPKLSATAYIIYDTK